MYLLLCPSDSNSRLQTLVHLDDPGSQTKLTKLKVRKRFPRFLEKSQVNKCGREIGEDEHEIDQYAFCTCINLSKTSLIFKNEKNLVIYPDMVVKALWNAGIIPALWKWRQGDQ